MVTLQTGCRLMSDVLNKDGDTSDRLPLDVGRLSKDGVTSERLPLDVGRFEQGWCHFREVAA